MEAYLYTNQIDQTVARLGSMARSGRLPSDLRFGVAVYKRAARADWTYRVA
jgi:plasmid stabilization system protein ParE